MTLRWESGGSATVLSYARDLVVVRSTLPFPPGAPVAANTEATPSLQVRGKVTSTRRLDADTFEVQLRLVMPTRELRDALESVAGTAKPPGV